MSREQSVTRYSGLWLFATLALSSLALRTDSDSITTVFSIVIALLVLNTSFIASKYLSYWFLISIYSGAALSLSITTILSINNPTLYSITINTVLIIALLITITFSSHRYTENLYSILSPFTPISILFSIVLGIFIGTQNTTMFIAVSIIDLVASCIIVSEERSLIRSLTLCSTAFASLHLHQVLGLDPRVFIVLLSIHIVRSTLLVFRKPIYTRAIVILDIVVRPLVVKLL